MFTLLCSVIIQLQSVQKKMKKIPLLLFVIALFLIASIKVNAQIGVSINLNLQPQWGPTDYDYVDYYYMPEYDLYYYAPQKQFIYQRGNRWVTVHSLPYQYRHVNLYNTYKVVINEPKPYLKHKYYADHYRGFKGQHMQHTIIRESRDPRYERGHEQPGYKEYKKNEKSEHRDMEYHDKGQDKGNRHKEDKGHKH